MPYPKKLLSVTLSSRDLLTRLLVLAATVLLSFPSSGSATIPGIKKENVAVLTTNETQGEFAEAIKKLGWKADRFNDDESGWKKLESNLNRYKVIIGTSGVRHLLPPADDQPESKRRATVLREFMEAGGAIILNETTTAQQLDWLKLIDSELEVSAIKPTKVPPKAAVGDTRNASLLRTYPTTLNHKEAPEFGYRIKKSNLWETGAAWADHAVVLLKRFGKGVLVITTLNYNDETLLANSSMMRRLQEMGFSYSRVTLEFENQAAFPNVPHISPGRGVARIAIRSTSSEPIQPRAVFRIRQGDAVREIFQTLREVGPTNSAQFAIPITADLRGKVSIELAFIDPADKSEIPVFLGESELPAYLSVIPPTYRGMISTARRDKNVHFKLQISPLHENVEGTPIKLKITNASGAVISEKELVAKSETFPVMMELPADAPAGAYKITAVATRKGMIEETATGDFTVVPVRPGQVFVDQDTVLLKEGKPFFPLGIYHVSAAQIDEVAELGFNLIQFWTHDASTQTMDSLHSKGIQALWEGHAWSRAVHLTSGDPSMSAPLQAELDKQREAVAKFKDHPALAMWYVADEPGTSHLPALKLINKTWHEADEDHPTYLVATGSYDRLHEACDVLGIDVYLVYRGARHPLTHIVNKTDQAMAGVDYRKPIIAIPQSFGNNKRHNETPEESRAMTYLHLVRGVKGIIWYCWKETGDPTGEEGAGFHPETQKVLKDMITEIKAISPALMEPGTMMVRSDDGKVYGMLCGSEATGRYFVYVNSEYTESNATLHLPELGEKSLKGLYGTRDAKAHNGALKLKVAPLATGILELK